MFVCSGNICRSPLAHRVLEHQARERGLDHLVEVESSGTGAWHVGDDADPRMRRTAAQHGVELHHPARALSQSDLAEWNIIFAMDRGHYRDIKGRIRRNRSAGTDTSSGRQEPELYLFRQFDPLVVGDDDIASVNDAPDVPDPYYGAERGFEEVYQMVERTCARILDKIERGDLR